MSNVPDLDDEQEILSGLQERFREQLGYDALTTVIHRYDSLSLLKQSLFVVERPNSRLSKEYLTLLNAITEENIQDRESVIQSLTRRKSYRMRARLARETQQKRIDDILKYHSRDGEVLYVLAMDLKRRGRLEESNMLLGRSIELGHRSPEALLAQAEVGLQDEDLSVKLSDVFEAFQSKDLDDDELSRGIDILRRSASQKLLEIAKTPAFSSLSALRCSVISYNMMWCKEGLQAAIDLLSRYQKASSLSVATTEVVRLSLSLCLIGLSRFEEAMRLFGNARPAPDDLSINDSFNYGVSEWGETDAPPKDMFERVVELDLKRDERDDANYHQCLAIALWVVGRNKDAVERIEEAKRNISEKPTSQFSCWRYMQVTPKDFLEDCESIKKLINGEKISPIFLQYKNSTR